MCVWTFFFTGIWRRFCHSPIKLISPSLDGQWHRPRSRKSYLAAWQCKPSWSPPLPSCRNFPDENSSIFPHLPFDKLVMLGGELEGVRVKTKCFLTKLFLHCSEILPQAIFPDNVKFVSRAAMCFIYLQLCAMALILIPVLNVFFLFGTCPYSWRFIYTHYNINNIFHYLRKKLFLHQHIRSSTYPYPLPPVKLNN